VLYIEKRLPKLAIDDLACAIALEPTNAKYHDAMGNALCDMRNLRDAIGHYTNAIKYDSSKLREKKRKEKKWRKEMKSESNQSPV
jgi:predicted sulfurtransferase